MSSRRNEIESKLNVARDKSRAIERGSAEAILLIFILTALSLAMLGFPSSISLSFLTLFLQADFMTILPFLSLSIFLFYLSFSIIISTFDSSTRWHLLRPPIPATHRLQLHVPNELSTFRAIITSKLLKYRTATCPAA